MKRVEQEFHLLNGSTLLLYTDTYVAMLQGSQYIPRVLVHYYSVEVIIWYGTIESHTGKGVQSTLTLAATSRLTADTSPD